MPSLQDSIFYHISQAYTPLRCVPTFAVRCRLFEPDANRYLLWTPKNAKLQHRYRDEHLIKSTVIIIRNLGYLLFYLYHRIK